MADTFLKVAGTVISASAALPATDNQAGYEALSWTECEASEIINFSGWSDTWEIESDNTYKLLAANDTKLRRKLGEISLELKHDFSNTAFHTILETAEADQDDVISFRVANNDAATFLYFTAQVKECNRVYGDSGSSISTSIVLLPQTARVEV